MPLIFYLLTPFKYCNAPFLELKELMPPATIRAYFADFAAFIAFCELKNQSALPANAGMTTDFIRHISVSGRSSASIRRAVVGISTINPFNRFTDPTKDPELRIAMKRMHRTP